MSETSNQATTAATAPFLSRVLLGATGAGLLLGFFLPWVKLGTMVSLSGLNLALTGGQAIESLSGPFGLIVFVVPLAGVALLFGAVRGYRRLEWLGLVSGCIIFGVGIFTLVRVFLGSTGMGMWLVAAASMAAIMIGTLSQRRN
jgi:hypothetical protein